MSEDNSSIQTGSATHRTSPQRRSKTRNRRPDIRTSTTGFGRTAGKHNNSTGSILQQPTSTSTNYYAFCVDMEQGWTGHDIMQSLDCFDLSAFMGEEVQVSFDFGSDSSVTYPGQYLLYVKVGAAGSTPTEGTTWGAIKGLFQ